jgi:hypothetical protein
MSPDRFTLRGLPATARLTLAVFLLAVGAGYGSALVQVHFRDSHFGQLLPGGDDMVKKLHGGDEAIAQVSPLERLIRTPDHEVPFSGHGSMYRAFTDRSEGWRTALKGRSEAEVVRERDGERDAILAWLHAGLSRQDYDADHFVRPPEEANKPITKDYLNDDGSVKIKTLFQDRCATCHRREDSRDVKAAAYPLEEYEQIQKHATVPLNGPVPPTMSLDALAQSTHAHLLSFAVLFAATGLIIAVSGYPAWLRIPLAPGVLVVQVLEIACWWLARLEGPTGVTCAKLVLVFGGLVGAGLALQIVLGLMDLARGAPRVERSAHRV